MRAATTLLAFALSMLVPAVGHAASSYAIVVGNNVPPPPPEGDGLTSLRYADDDALRYASLFRQFSDQTRVLAVLDAETRKRFPDERVDAPPTLRALRRELRAIADAPDIEESVVYVVFSGHGALGASGDAFLSMLDGRLSRDVLFEDILSDVPAARVHLIIDACHAAGVVGLRGKRKFGKEVDGKTSPVPTQDARSWAASRTLDRFPHVGVLAATSAGEQAHEWSEIESGVFSHEVLSSLWGLADINGDLRVEYSEVQAFVASANRGIDDPRAAPSVVSRPPPVDPHEPLIDLSAFRTTALLTGDASKLGHFHVELGNGQRHVDANLGGTATIAIPAGQAFLRTAAAEYVISAEPGVGLSLDGLSSRPPSTSSRGSTDATYRRALFAEAYNRDYYRGYVDSIGATPVTFAAPKERGAPSKSPPPPSPRNFVPTAPPPSVLDDPKKNRRDPRRGAGIAMAVLAGGAGAACIGTAIAAVSVRMDFSSSNLESQAHELDQRHRRLAGAAIGSATFAIIAGTAAALLLVKRKPAPPPPVNTPRAGVIRSR